MVARRRKNWSTLAGLILRSRGCGQKRAFELEGLSGLANPSNQIISIPTMHTKQTLVLVSRCLFVI